jgi:hypothetical protein
MRVTVPLHTGVRESQKTLAASPRAIEKTSASSALGREQQGRDDTREKAAVPLQVELVYRDDTPRFDPFWDAPRLLPTFVTQVLGQAMPERRENVCVETAYGRATSPRKALLLDRKS